MYYLDHFCIENENSKVIFTGLLSILFVVYLAYLVYLLRRSKVKKRKITHHNIEFPKDETYSILSKYMIDVSQLAIILLSMN